jgi:hypothetical protein
MGDIREPAPLHISLEEGSMNKIGRPLTAHRPCYRACKFADNFKATPPALDPAVTAIGKHESVRFDGGSITRQAPPVLLRAHRWRTPSPSRRAATTNGSSRPPRQTWPLSDSTFSGQAGAMAFEPVNASKCRCDARHEPRCSLLTSLISSIFVSESINSGDVGGYRTRDVSPVPTSGADVQEKQRGSLAAGAGN